MSVEKFDVVVLGGGNAGIGVTGPVRRAGMSVAMIEARDLGGTCPNRGCTPKKILVAAGHALHEIERAAPALGDEMPWQYFAIRVLMSSMAASR